MKNMIVMIVLTAFLLGAPASGQAVRQASPPDDKLSEEVDKARMEWKKADNGQLESGLLERDPKQAKEEIDRAREARSKLDPKLQKELEKRYEDAQAVVELYDSVARGGHVPGVDIEDSIEKQRDSLDGETIRLMEGAESETASVLEKEQIGEQLKQIQKLQVNLARQKELARQMRENDVTEKAERLSGYARKILSFWGDAKQLHEEEATAWQDYYDGLNELVEDHADSEKTKSSKN